MGLSDSIAALAVGYGHLVPADTVGIERRVPSVDGELNYEFPVAGLAAWLCLKADAIMLRAKHKDSFDVVWLLAALGPEAAAKTIAQSPLIPSPHHDALVRQLERLVDDQFLDDSSVGPVSHARFLHQRDEPAQRRYATGVVRAFGAELRTLGVLDPK